MRTLQTVEGTPRCLVRVRTRPVCLTAFVLILSTASVGAQQPQAVPVGTIYAERQPIAQTRAFVGRIEATDRVEIRARVKGYLDAVLFKEGEIVKKGDPLYRIEKGLFQADVVNAQGALERTKAAKTLTAIQLQRAQDLLEKNAGTAVARDQALAADQQAEGAIMADQASLDTANINLGYTDIVSPIELDNPEAQAEYLAHAMGNTLNASNALYQTYVPANEATVSQVNDARRIGRGKLRDKND